MKLLYLVRIIRDIINQITLFFIPIFVFEQSTHIFNAAGVSVLPLDPLHRSLLVMAGFYILERIAIFITILPLGKLTKRIGFSKAFFFSYLFRLCVFVGLIFVPTYPLLVIPIALIEGMQANLFWPGYFTLFCENAEYKKIGSSMGILQFFLQLVGAITPAIGGFMAYRYGFSSLFLLATVLQLISLCLVGLITIQRQHDTVSWTEFMRWMKREPFFTQTVAYAGRYINDAVMLLWPLYIYLILGGVDRMGYLFTVSLILALICVVAVGVYIDRMKGKTTFYLSGIGLALLWFIRAVFTFPWLLASIQTSEKVIGSVYWLMFDISIVKLSRGAQAFSFFVYRELVMSATGILFWSCISVALFYSTDWHFLFITAGIGTLTSLLLVRHAK